MIEDNQNNSWSTNVKVNSPNTIATDLWVDDQQFENYNTIDPGEILSIYLPTK